jgi:hypothetical protein
MLGVGMPKVGILQYNGARGDLGVRQQGKSTEYRQHLAIGEFVGTEITM